MWDTHIAQRLYFFVQTTAILGISTRIHKTLGIILKLMITSHASNVIKEVSTFLAYCRRSFVTTLNHTYFHMRWIVRIEAEISLNVGGVSVDFGD